MPSNEKRMTVPGFRDRKGQGTPLVVLTAYDVPSALAAEAGGVDAMLVGDSLGNVLLGHENTLPVTLEDMIHHGRAVARVRRRALLIVDMPWLTYHVSPADALRNAARLIRETRADAVKLEGGARRVPVIRAILDAEIPVMGHLGLTPQSVLRMGGYRVQGRGETEAAKLLEDARALAGAGAFAIVLEGIPVELADRITRTVDVPTIGIGAGSGCDGQVLVYHDLLGILPQAPPKFVRRYDDTFARHSSAIERWASDVRERKFPADSETYH